MARAARTKSRGKVVQPDPFCQTGARGIAVRRVPACASSGG